MNTAEFSHSCIAHSPMWVVSKNTTTTQWESDTLLGRYGCPGVPGRYNFPDSKSEGRLPEREDN